MKRIYNITKIAVLFALFGYCGVANAQGTSGNWEATEISSTKTINLTGNVTIKGTITIASGTLTINANRANRTITAASDFKGSLFKVNSGAALVINGTNANQITIDGSTTNFTFTKGNSPIENPHKLTVPEGISRRAIHNQGKLTLKYVTIEDFAATGEGGAILIDCAQGRDDAGNVVSYSKSDKTRLENCTIRRCQATNGAAIKVTNQSSEYETNHTNSDGNACSLTIINSTITNCYSTDNETSGILRSNGGAVGSLYLTNVKFLDNYSSYSGGGLYWNAHGAHNTQCVIDGCTFDGNMAYERGGAIMLEANFSFVNNRTELKNNQVGGNGGGLVITGYGGGADTQENYELAFNLSEYLNIHDNKAKNGGGVAFIFGSGMTLPMESTINTNFNGAIIEDNIASEKGGALYFENYTDKERGYKININLNHGELKNNSAKLGGGVYVYDEMVNAQQMSGKQLLLDNNEATNDGGAIYIQGGSLTMAEGVISNNTASQNGGGICMSNGAFSIKKGDIVNNEASQYGGGLYVVNTDDEGKTITFSGGTLSRNNAVYGGGVCASGNLALKISGVTIERNTSTNGGGIYLTQGASMDFGSGKIRNNQALYSDNYTLGTAYGIDADKVKGVGGGIYLDSNTTLTFSVTTELGLYGNQAAIGADDIFANGNNTSVALPNVSDMVLEGFKAPNSLYWVEDYIVSDEEYENHGTGEWSGDTRRYRELLASQDAVEYPIVEVTGSSLELKQYVSLALGYEIIYITIQKQGLKTGESAMFILTQRGTDNKTWLPEYMRVLLTGSTTGGVVSRKVGVPSGYWKVEETNWSWAYTFEPENGIEREIIDTKEDYIFEFINTPKNNTPERDEDVKVNEFNKPVTTTTKKL